MMNCKHVTQLASDSLDKKLGFSAKMQFWTHLAMCGLCSRFRKSIVRIEDEAKAHALQLEEGKALLEVKLPDEARVRIRQAIDRDGNQ